MTLGVSLSLHTLAMAATSEPAPPSPHWEWDGDTPEASTCLRLRLALPEAVRSLRCASRSPVPPRPERGLKENDFVGWRHGADGGLVGLGKVNLVRYSLFLPHSGSRFR